MDEINQIAEELKIETNPIMLVDYLTKLAGWAAYYEGLLQPIQMMKPEKWLAIQKAGDGYKLKTNTGVSNIFRPLSDKKTEMTWAATPEGQQEIKYVSKLKQIALMTAAIKQNLWAKKIEYRNLNPNI